MNQPQGQSRVCPTRVDDKPVLFAHRLSAGQCQDRQRGRYHKCYTCVHNNAWVSANGPRDAKRKAAAPAGAGDKPELALAARS